MYPALSEAIHHFKDTEEGRGTVCERVENYAKEYAKEMSLIKVIKALIYANMPLERIIEIIKKDDSEISEDYIISQYNSIANGDIDE
jgi:glycerol-3-phosphate dehydrogenase